MRIYTIGFGLWLFCLTLSMVNSLGIFQYTMPTQNVDQSVGTAQITQITNTGSQSVGTEAFNSFWGGGGMLLQAFGFFLTSIPDSIIIVNLADTYGIDRKISIPFQAAYSFILLFGIIQFMTGRGAKVME